MPVGRSLIVILCSMVFLSSLSDEAMARKGGGLLGLVLRHTAVKAHSNTGTKVYSANTLGIDELRNCIAQEGAIDDARKALDIIDRELTHKTKNLDVMHVGLSEAGNALDRYDQRTIDAYNQRVDAYEIDRLALEADIGRQNGLVEEMNRLVLSFNTQCARKDYYEDDMSAALQTISP